MELLSTHIQILKYSSYSYLTTRMMLLISAHNSIAQHIQQAQNKYDTRVLTLKYLLEGCSACCCSALIQHVNCQLQENS